MSVERPEEMTYRVGVEKALDILDEFSTDKDAVQHVLTMHRQDLVSYFTKLCERVERAKQELEFAQQMERKRRGEPEPADL